MTLIDDYPDKHPRIPACPCCGGTGMHEHKPFINASPHDEDTECTTCAGRGRSWFEVRQNSCSGYHLLMKRFR